MEKANYHGHAERSVSAEKQKNNEGAKKKVKWYQLTFRKLLLVIIPVGAELSFYGSEVVKDAQNARIAPITKAWNVSENGFNDDIDLQIAIQECWNAGIEPEAVGITKKLVHQRLCNFIRKKIRWEIEICEQGHYSDKVLAEMNAKVAQYSTIPLKNDEKSSEITLEDIGITPEKIRQYIILSFKRRVQDLRNFFSPTDYEDLIATMKKENIFWKDIDVDQNEMDNIVKEGYRFKATEVAYRIIKKIKEKNETRKKIGAHTEFHSTKFKNNLFTDIAVEPSDGLLNDKNREEWTHEKVSEYLKKSGESNLSVSYDRLKDLVFEYHEKSATKILHSLEVKFLYFSYESAKDHIAALGKTVDEFVKDDVQLQNNLLLCAQQSIDLLMSDIRTMPVYQKKRVDDILQMLEAGKASKEIKDECTKKLSILKKSFIEKINTRFADLVSGKFINAGTEEFVLLNITSLIDESGIGLHEFAFGQTDIVKVKIVIEERALIRLKNMLKESPNDPYIKMLISNQEKELEELKKN